MRRYVIREKAYQRVHAWIKKAQKAQADEPDGGGEAKGSGSSASKKPVKQPLSEFEMPADYLPRLVWAHKSPLSLVKTAHGKEVIYVREANVLKRLLHNKEIDGYLREALLSPSSDVPLSRDAGYHIVQKRTVGISRRAFQAFIRKQAVLQITRNQLPAMKRPGRPLEGRGYLELDLVEAKGRDIGKFVHHPVKDFYWITLIDRLTGWLETKQTTKKDVKHVAPKLGTMLRKMARVLKTPVKYIRSDSGSEFKSDTQAVFKELGIRHKFVKSGNRIEQANRTFQRIWYRLMRLGRGDIYELDVQAQAIFNNTKSGVTGYTPEEALDVSDKTLAEAFNANRRKVAKYKAVEIKVGDRVRHIMKDVVGKYGKGFGYKTYRGKHWSADVYPVVKINTHEDTYYVAKKWRDRDKLLKVPGVDAITRDAVTARHRKKKKDWVDVIGELAL